MTPENIANRIFESATDDASSETVRNAVEAVKEVSTRMSSAVASNFRSNTKSYRASLLRCIKPIVRAQRFFRWVDSLEEVQSHAARGYDFFSHTHFPDRPRTLNDETRASPPMLIDPNDMLAVMGYTVQKAWNNDPTQTTEEVDEIVYTSFTKFCAVDLPDVPLMWSLQRQETARAAQADQVERLPDGRVKSFLIKINYQHGGGRDLETTGNILHAAGADQGDRMLGAEVVWDNLSSAMSQDGLAKGKGSSASKSQSGKVKAPGKSGKPQSPPRSKASKGKTAGSTPSGKAPLAKFGISTGKAKAMGYSGKRSSWWTPDSSKGKSSSDAPAHSWWTSSNAVPWDSTNASGSGTGVCWATAQTPASWKGSRSTWDTVSSTASDVSTFSAENRTQRWYDSPAHWYSV